MNRISDEKIKAIAAEYLTNGMVKTKALITVGYSKNYAEHGGLKLFDNDRLKDEIAHQQAKTELKNDITVASIQQDLIRQREMAEKVGNINAAVRCTELLGKTIGGFQADAPSDKAIAAKLIDSKDRKLLREIADRYYASKYLVADVKDTFETPQDGVESTNSEGIVVE